MKKRRLITLASIILIAIVGFAFWNVKSTSHPVLAFMSYERSGTNTAQFARLELQNTTTTPIWLFLSGGTLSPGFLERPIFVPPNTTNGGETNLYSVTVGSFFMRGEKLLPGNNLELDFPLVSGKPPEQVGVSYYVGNFKDGNDFLDSMMIQLQGDNASLKDRINYWWQRSKRLFKTRKHFEVWCPQPLSFQAEKSLPTNNPAR